MTDVSERARRLEEEQRWYEQDGRETGRAATALRRILQSPLFHHPARGPYAYGLVDARLRDLLRREAPKFPDGPLLNLPAGNGYDYPLIDGLGRPIVAADLSTLALADAQRAGPHPCVCCDSMQLPFDSGTFAAVVMNKFLHHVVDDGFAPYLRECWRVLRPGGFIVIQEPSIWHPVNLATVTARAGLRRVLGTEPLGHVPHERAFRPRLLVDGLRSAGFADVATEGSSFVHNRFPVTAGRAIAAVQDPFLKAPVTKQMAWWILFSGWKPAA